MKVTLIILATIAALGITGCQPGGGGPSFTPDVPDPDPIDLNGSWSGTWESTILAVSGTVDLDLVWDEATETADGTGFLVGNPCFSDVDAHISIGGFRRFAAELTPPSAMYFIIADGSVSNDSDTFGGTYSVEVGSLCLGDAGTIVVHRN